MSSGGVYVGTSGDDTIHGSTGDDTIQGEAGNDQLYGDDGADVIDGGSGDDKLFGENGNDLLSGNGGNDEISGGDGNDTLHGNDGHDTLEGGTGDDVLTGDAGDDTLKGDDGNDRLYGGDGADDLDGGNGDDQLFGGMGDDILRLSVGNDILIGNEGNDTAIFSGSWSDYTITLNAGGGYDVVDNRVGAGAGTTKIYSVENFTFSDGTVAAADAPNDAPDLSVTGNIVAENAAAGTVVSTLSVTDPDSLDHHVYALTSDPSGLFEIVGNELRVKAGADIDRESAAEYTVELKVTDAHGASHVRSIVIEVTDVDEFDVTSITDTDSAANEVTENSAAGTAVGIDADATDADATDDISFQLVDTDGDPVTGGPFSIDSATGKVQVADPAQVNFEAMGPTYTLYIKAVSTDGSTIVKDFTIAIEDIAENLTLTGGDDVFTDDGVTELSVDGGAGHDDITGSTGNDDLDGGTGNDKLNGGDGNDDLDGGDGHDELNGGNGDDTLKGGDGFDELNGGDGNDDLDGGDGIDELNGGAGDDTLTGGAGNDILDGGDGTDKAIYNGDWKDYEITENPDGSYTVKDLRPGAPDGTDIVRNIENLQFADGQVPTAGAPNDAPTDITASNNSVAENAPDGTVIGVLSAVDADTLDSHSFSLASDPSGLFEIVGNELRVKAGADIDYEAASSHVIDVTTTDSHGATVTKSLTIQVVDQNDEAVGAISDSDATANHVLESASIGSLVGVTAMATDTDAADTVSYAITDNSGAVITDSPFAIHSTNGKISVADPTKLSFEYGDTRVVYVKATSTDSSTSMTSFTIAVGDVAENLTLTGGDDVFTDDGVTELSVDGGAGHDDITGSTGNDDLDGGTGNDELNGGDGNDDLDGGDGIDELNGGAGDDTLTGGAGNDILDGGDGTDKAIYNGDWKDYEITENPDGSYTVKDLRPGAPDGTDIVRNIENLQFADGQVPTAGAPNDAPTDITASNNSVAENAPDGTVIGVLSAVDADTLDSHSFSLASDPSGLFEIVGNELRVKAGADIDYEAASSHVIDVTTTDSHGATVTKSLTIQVVDQNDEAVGAISDSDATANHVLESASIGSLVGVTAMATDTDAADTVSYAITDNSGAVITDSPFAIHSTNGKISVADPTKLSFEYGDTRVVYVKATSTDSSTSMTSFTIAVGDVAENLTLTGGDDVFTDDGVTELSVDGGAGHDDITGSTGNDDLDGGTGNDELNGGDGNDDLDGGDGIDELNGGAGDDTLTGGAGNDILDGGDGTDKAIYNGDWKDYEITENPDGSYTVKDLRPGAPDGTDIVRNIENLQFADGQVPTAGAPNDAPTDITASNNSVAENAPDGTVIGVLSAVDADTLDSHSFSLASDPSGLFEIVGNELRVKAGADIDYEAASSHVIDVTTTDSHGATVTKSLTIQVVDQNDEAVGAISDSDATANHVLESASIGSLVGVTAMATDTDAADTVSYAITDNSGAVITDSPFAIHSTNGKISVADPTKLSFEYGDTRVVYVKATSTDSSTSMTSFTIAVGDVAENLTLTGGDDVFTDDGVTELSVDGGAGHDDITGSTGNDDLDGGTGNDELNGGDGNDDLDGGDGIDELNGGAGDDTLTGGAGNDILDGGDGTDKAIYNGDWKDYEITENPDGSYTVKDLRPGAPDGTDIVRNIENLQFADGQVPTAGAPNDAPTDITASNNSVAENAPDGTVIGVLSAVDADTLDSHSFSLASDPSGLFEIVGNELRVKAGADIDYEAASSHVIDVTTTDSHGATVTKSLTIQVVDQNDEAVGAISDSDATANHVLESASIGSLVGVTAMATDTDAADTVSYAITDNSGAIITDSPFAIHSTNGKISVADPTKLSFEDGDTRVVYVKATSTDSSTSMTSFTIAVGDVAENLTLTGGDDVFTDIGVTETSVHGGAGDDNITGTANSDNLFGDAGSDWLKSGDGNDTLDGGDGNDALFGGNDDDTITGGIGNDLLNGEAGNDNLAAGAGDDWLFGWTGEDMLDGGTGNDRLYGGDGNDSLQGDAGNDQLYGGDGNDSLKGGDDDDTLLGEAGNDHLEGGLGNDTLNGGIGDDELKGDAGQDFLHGWSGQDTIYGGNDNDRLYGWGDDDILYGEQGADYLAGGAGNDTLNGGTENDELFGGDGDDQLDGGTGDDLLNGEAGVDVLRGADGNDELHGWTGNDTLYGDAGNDRLFGGGDDDTLNGGAGSDSLYGQGGHDTLNGDGDDDTLYGQDGNDTLNGGAGNDELYGGGDNDTITGGTGDDLLNGESGNDNLVAGDGDDWLFGWTGNDTLDGGAGNDHLYGGDGDDTITSGDGVDQFIFTAGLGDDVVTDFDVDSGDIIYMFALGPTTFAELQAIMTEASGNTLISFASGDSISLQGVTTASLSDDDFHFVI